MNSDTEKALQQAIDEYCDDCLARIPAFVDGHFRGAGARALNRHAFGWDLFKLPLNIAWAPLWLLLQLFAQLFKVLRLKSVADLLMAVPAGFNTRLQGQLSQLIETELLGVNQSHPDPLLPYMAPLMGVDEKAWQVAIEGNALQSQSQQLKARLFGSRTAVAELSSSLGMVAVGAVAFKQFTPGAIGGGAALASWWTLNQAQQSFWLGEGLGAVWYGWFPPAIAWFTQLGATLLLVLLLALAASFSGFITDPLQARLGLHQRRLRALVEKLRIELKRQLVADSRSREQYLARLADVTDWVSLAISKAG